jgi:thioredoxin reductase/ferredoxin
MNTSLILFGFPIISVILIYVFIQKRKEKKSIEKLNDSIRDNLVEPPSIHPVFKPDICIGCEGCVDACPEGAIGVIDGKGALVSPTKCIGHGACQIVCPVEGIELVFGTDKRGIDIPHLTASFETNIKNIFIAGELGGMGLVRKSAEQGAQAIKEIEKRKNNKAKFDVVIIGAGPAGIAASLGAKEKGLRYIAVEQEDSLGGAVYHYPRHKLTMTSPVRLPIVGELKIFDIQKEELLEIWKSICQEHALKINFSERMETITPTSNGFLVKTSKAEYETTCVLLAIGRRGTPRKLDVPGENQKKVVYSLMDPEQYAGQNILVVGGGDSAIEATLALANQPNTSVSLSYRNESFGRIKQKNKELLEKAIHDKKINLLLKSNVKEIKVETVLIEHEGNMLELKNDTTIICAGGVLPTPFLKEIGILVETHHGKTKHKIRCL